MCCSEPTCCSMRRSTDVWHHSWAFFEEINCGCEDWPRTRYNLDFIYGNSVQNTISCLVSDMVRKRLLRLDHIVLDQAAFLSPLIQSTYMDEDLMGRIKLAVASSPMKLSFQVLSRYAAYICCRWLRHSE